MDEHLSYVPGAEQTAPKPQHRSPLRVMECVMHALFLLCGLIAIAFVLFISFYLILSGLPAIRTIGLTEFLFGQTWASTAWAACWGEWALPKKRSSSSLADCKPMESRLKPAWRTS